MLEQITYDLPWQILHTKAKKFKPPIKLEPAL